MLHQYVLVTASPLQKTVCGTCRIVQDGHVCCHTAAHTRPIPHMVPVNASSTMAVMLLGDLRHLRNGHLNFRLVKLQVQTVANSLSEAVGE